MFVTARNEVFRFPYFFKYYSELGVDRFFVIDNGSTDDILPFLLSCKNTHVFKTCENFKESYSGAIWSEHLLNKYGKNNWCMILDPDEIFIYPNYEKVTLKGLCEFLDQKKCNAINSILLDMYSNKPIKDSKYMNGKSPVADFPYFDKDTHYKVECPIWGSWQGK